jgi:glycosyltransferase involved in cell wall biosynthesis
LTNELGVKNVVHIHSGRFDEWLVKPTSYRTGKVVRDASKFNISFVGLSSDWKVRLSRFLGDVHCINNPIHPKYVNQEHVRENVELLLLGRNDSVKGHDFAIGVAAKLRGEFPNLQLTMTGTSSSPHAWVNALGWVSEEEKMALLGRASILLLPSKYEGQPMVVLEALASGLPVVAFRHLNSLSDAVHRAGPNVSDWCATLRSLLNDPVPLNFDEESYDVENISNQWGVYYESLLAK